MASLLIGFWDLKLREIWAWSMQKWLALTVVLLVPLFMQAKVMKIEEVLTSKKQFRFVSSIKYDNIEKKDILKIDAIDIVTLSLGLRYGITDALEVFGALDGLYEYKSSFDPSILPFSGTLQTRHRFSFSGLSLGIGYEVLKENEYPSLILGVDTKLIDYSILDDAHKGLQYFKTYSIFLLSFYTVDPVIFFLQANYDINAKRNIGNLSFDAGQTFTLSPSIYFAVTPYVSLNWGIKYRLQTQNKLNGRVLSPLGSSLGYNFGLNYEIRDNLLIFLDAEFLQTSHLSNKSLNVSLSHAF